MNKYIFSFSQLSQLLYAAQTDSITDDFRSAQMYVYLSWLGLTPADIKTAFTDDYSPETGMLSVDGRDIMVCEEEIRQCISVREKGRSLIHGGLKFCGLAAELAASLGLDPILVLRSGAMYRRFEQGTKPTLRELRAMGIDEAGFEAEFCDYSAQRELYFNKE